ncbi:MAG: OadG family protein [Clostridia bacterium]|nr:OadG family protein [Clostridia bacterium]
MDVSNGIVIGLGLGIVFAGLICLVIICSLLGQICKRLIKPEAESAAPAVNSAPAAAAPIANKQELIAAICAAIAEELGTEASNIRVTSFKRL